METTEQAIEKMTERGFLIDSVMVANPIDHHQWTSLDDLETLPGESLIMLFGKNADGNVEGSVSFCTDFKWLKDWWKGGWQANI